MKEETHPESGTTSYNYDSVGNMTDRWDDDGTPEKRHLEFRYDGNNRLEWSGATGTTFGYDAWDRRTRMSRAGVVDTSFGYDKAGRLTQRVDEVVVGGVSRLFESSYGYDGNGNLTRVSYPNGREKSAEGSTLGNHVCYARDEEGRITSVKRGDGSCVQNVQTLASDLEYHPSGALWAFTAGGITQSFTYDSRLRLLWSNSPGVLELDYRVEFSPGRFGYDGVGNLRAMRQQRPGGEWQALSFGYDALDRLTSASGPWGSTSYAYDAEGNRTVQTRNDDTTLYDYEYIAPTDDTPGRWTHRLKQTRNGQNVVRETFLYSEAGDLTGDDRGSYSYTPSHMLQQATFGDGPVYTFQYDGDDQRLAKHAGGLRSTYFVHGVGGLLSEFELSGTTFRWMVDYVYLGGRLLAAFRPGGDTGLSIADVTGSEGSSGTRMLRFTVSLSPEFDEIRVPFRARVLQINDLRASWA